jgi:hypothetical protein
MLNQMIFESMEKYDEEIERCTQFYSEHCGAMEECRGKISQANYEAASARMHILDSQGNINRCEEDIPTRKYELRQHLLKCKADLYKLNTRLKIVAGDIAVMTRILEMTDCDAQSFVQMKAFDLLQCQDPCTHKSFIAFNHSEIQQKMSQLQSSFTTDLISDTFKDLFHGFQEIQSIALMSTKQEPVINKTKFNNPPVPFTKVPADPCQDPNAGAPASQVKTTFKNTNKCTLCKTCANCYKLQERFLLIQAGIQDEHDEILEEIAMLERFCEETKQTLEKQISDDERLLAASQTKLADSMTKEATAGEVARTTAQEHDKLETELQKQMKTCTNNYQGYESEICALKKIRGELYKLRGTGNTDMFFSGLCSL